MPRNYSVTLGAPALSGTVLWEGGFDSGFIPPYSDAGGIVGGTDDPSNQYVDVEMTGNSTSLNNAPTLEFDTTQVRNSRSSRSLKTTMRGRTATGTSAGTQRAQWHAKYFGSPDYAFTPTDNGLDNDYWIGWSIYFGTEWGNFASYHNGSIWHNWFGARHQGANGPGTFQVKDYSGAKWFILRRQFQEYTWPDGQGFDDKQLLLAVSGQWVDFIWHCQFSTSTLNALSEMWANGTKVSESTLQNAVPSSSNGGDIRIRPGPYINTAYDPNLTVWYDNVRIGTSYDAVNPASLV